MTWPEPDPEVLRAARPAQWALTVPDGGPRYLLSASSPRLPRRQWSSGFPRNPPLPWPGRQALTTLATAVTRNS